MMEKNPTTCGKSVEIGGTYICRLELLPCAAVDKCAMEKVQEMVETVSKYIHEHTKKGKEKT